MTRELQVWGTDHLFVKVDGHTSQRHAIVAARTKKDAAAALGMTVRSLNTWASTSGNARDLEVAMAEPGVVFHCSVDDYDGRDYRRLER